MLAKQNQNKANVMLFVLPTPNVRLVQLLNALENLSDVFRSTGVKYLVFCLMGRFPCHSLKLRGIL